MNECSACDGSVQPLMRTRPRNNQLLQHTRSPQQQMYRSIAAWSLFTGTTNNTNNGSLSLPGWKGLLMPHQLLQQEQAQQQTQQPQLQQGEQAVGVQGPGTEVRGCVCASLCVCVCVRACVCALCVCASYAYSCPTRSECNTVTLWLYRVPSVEQAKQV